MECKPNPQVRYILLKQIHKSSQSHVTVLLCRDKLVTNFKPSLGEILENDNGHPSAM